MSASPLDLLVLGMVFVAMLLSRQPKRGAIALCMFAPLIITGADYFPFVFHLELAILVEVLIAMLLLVLARFPTKFEDRSFFRLMSCLLLVSSGASGLYMIDVMAQSQYLWASRTVGLGQAFFMLGYSDGIRDVVRRIFALNNHTGGHSSNS